MEWVNMGLSWEGFTSPEGGGGVGYCTVVWCVQCCTVDCTVLGGATGGPVPTAYGTTGKRGSV